MNGLDDLAILLATLAGITCILVWHFLRAVRDYMFCVFCRQERPVKAYWFQDFTEIYCKRCGKLLRTIHHHETERVK